MAKKATKAAESVFYKARIKAASFNDRLSSREGAAEETGIDRTRIANIELGTIRPYPEEVMILADTYNAPELMYYHCSCDCPIGKQISPVIANNTFEQSTLQLVSDMKVFPEKLDALVDVVKDGEIESDEFPIMDDVLNMLSAMKSKITQLELLYSKRVNDKRKTDE